jgi:elongator complex protein 1
MLNVDIQSVSMAQAVVPVDHTIVRKCARIVDLAGTPAVYTLTESSSSILLSCTALSSGRVVPWQTADDMASFRAFPSDTPVALEVDAAGCEPLLVALRGGAILSIDSDTGKTDLIGDVVDDDGVEERNGILALARSPDGALVVVVSPVKIIVMSSCNWALVGEVDVLGVGVEASVSWRGDGAAFVVTMRDAEGVFRGRVVDRDVAAHVRLDYERSNAATNSGDHTVCAVAWQPRVGGFIAVTGLERGITFFERNGLRHLRCDIALGTCWSSRAKDLAPVTEECDFCCPDIIGWSSDNRMLAVVSGNAPGTFTAVDLYVQNNYKWDHKACLPLAAGSSVANLCWDSEETNVLHVISSVASVTTFKLRSSYTGSASGQGVPNTCAVVAVVDGSSARITNLSTAIIPPPMCHGVITTLAPISTVCFNSNGAKIGALLSDGRFQVFSGAFWRNKDNGDCSVSVWDLDTGIKLGCDSYLRHPVMLGSNFVSVVAGDGVDGDGDVVIVYRLDTETNAATFVTLCRIPDGRIMVVARHDDSSCDRGEHLLLIATSAGTVVRMSVSNNGCLTLLNSVSCVAASSAVSAVVITADLKSGKCCGDKNSLLLVHDSSGRLEVVNIDAAQHQAHVVSLECTSFCLSGGYLAYTTRSHVMHCVSIEASIVSEVCSTDMGPQTAKQKTDMSNTELCPPATKSGLVRPIDRGSYIVTGLPNDVRIVLQTPRGNLETIAPRPLVVQRVWRLARAKEYGSAFRLSRQQRIDMNVMVDADPDDFLLNVDRLVDQVLVPSHLSVFLTYLQGPDARINAVCSAVVKAIDRKYAGASDGGADRFTSTVLTALVRLKPPDYVTALRRVQSSYAQSESEGASALDFLLVLAKDEDMLYGEALGTYDLSLALMVAKASQLDPADYSSELRTLKRMGEDHKRYAIDLRLKRYESALENLFACGVSERNTCLKLAREHALYVVALPLFAAVADSELDGRAALTQLRGNYAVHLLTKTRYEDAAIVYCVSGDFANAATAYRDAGMWQQALDAFMQAEDVEDAAVRQFSESVVDSLNENGRAVESARVKWTMLQNMEGALDDLGGAQEWTVAMEIVASVNLASARKHWRDRVIGDLKDAGKEHAIDLRASTAKMTERSDRLVAVRQTKERMRTALGTPGGAGATGEDDADSDAFSASTGASSVGSDGGVSVALSDMTFASSTASARSQTSLYHSVGRGSGRGGRGRGRGGSGHALSTSAQRRAAGKQARKRVRTGHPQEEAALCETLRRLVPGAFQLRRVGACIRALAGEGLVTEARELSHAMADALAGCAALPADLAAEVSVIQAITSQNWRLPVLETL